jgi:hypothetical protein
MGASTQNPAYSHYLLRYSIMKFAFLHEIHSYETVSVVSDVILGIHKENESIEIHFKLNYDMRNKRFYSEVNE